MPVFYEQITTTAPVSDDAMITTQLNEAHAFAAAEFPFTDADGDNPAVGAAIEPTRCRHPGT
jgi:hypothetical protein